MISIFYEYKDYGNKNSLVFRLSQQLFILKKFIFINRVIVDGFLDICSLFVPLVYMNNTGSVIIFKDAIVINRLDAEKNDISLLYMVLQDFVSKIYANYNVLDLSNIEQYLEPRFDNDKAMLIKGRLMEFIHIRFHDLFTQHGGYVSVEDVDISNKIISLKLMGNCFGCKYRNVLLSQIIEFVRSEISPDYKLKIL